MKILIAAAGLATLLVAVTPASARPHHRQCRWEMHHHHRVRHCW